MIEQLIEAQWDMMLGTSLPRQRFFTPNDRFWAVMDSLKAKFDMIIDCGTGNGELPFEAREYGIKMAGVDIIKRDDNEPCEVQIIPAHRMPYSDRIWALACRPNHSGWCNLLQVQAQEAGAGFIYVGLPKNIDNDLLLDFPPDDRVPNVGEEGESMLVWLPA